MSESQTDGAEHISLADINRATESQEHGDPGGSSGHYPTRVVRDSSKLFGRHHSCGDTCKQPCEMTMYRSREAFMAGIKTATVEAQTAAISQSAPLTANQALGARDVILDGAQSLLSHAGIETTRVPVSLDLAPAKAGDDVEEGNSLMQGYVQLNQVLQNEINALKKKLRAEVEARQAAVASQERVTNQLEQLKTLINRITA